MKYFSICVLFAACLFLGSCIAAPKIASLPDQKEIDRQRTIQKQEIKTMFDENRPMRYVNVRIFVEAYTARVSATTPEGKYIESILSIEARHHESLLYDIKTANETYAPLHIMFCVDEVRYIQPLDNAINTAADLFLYKQAIPDLEDSDVLSVVYIFTHGGKPYFSGLSTFPPQMKINSKSGSNAIFMIGSESNYKGLSHEIGHYFGLLHTFDPDGDQVTDTFKMRLPSNSTTFDLQTIRSIGLGKEGKDPDFDNLMTYGTGTYLSPQQLRRANYYLTTDRKTVILEKAGLPLTNERIASYHNAFVISKYIDLIKNQEHVYDPADVPLLLAMWKLIEDFPFGK